jgi:ribose 5-phosphate isomerase B
MSAQWLSPGEATVALASDHAALEMRAAIAKHLSGRGYDVLDLGTNTIASVDYSDYGNAIAAAVTDGRAAVGVALCGSGIGISIAINRHAGARGALCYDDITARLSRQHNNANILVLGARIISLAVALSAVDTFIETAFEGGRHVSRVEKLG